MFYFQQLLQQGLNGIDRTELIPSVVGIAYAILLIGFLIGLYQAAMRGGDLQSLAVTGIKYLAVAIVLANWSTIFRDVNDSFNQVAQYIDSSSGAGDMFLSWFDQLKQQFGTNGISAILPAISASFAAITTTLMILAAYLIYAIMVVIFAFFYVLYGCVLYVLGPLVLALLPMATIGQLAKSYATNLMIWNAWGILYAIFGSLITAIQLNRVDEVMNQGFFQGFFQGPVDTVALGMVSIFYALALGLIPFIAKRLISGDVGSTAFSLMRAGAAAAGAVLAGVSGFAAGAGEAAAASGSTGAAAGGSSSTTSVMAESSTAPRTPTMPEFIRSGMASAMSSSASPGQPAVQANGSGGNGSQSRSSTASGASRAAYDVLRSHRMSQVVTFNMARALGRAVGRNKPEDN